MSEIIKIDLKNIDGYVTINSEDNGDIYLGKYEGLYCEGCESYKTLSELNDDGQCLLHPTRQIQKIEDEPAHHPGSLPHQQCPDSAADAEPLPPSAATNARP